MDSSQSKDYEGTYNHSLFGVSVSLEIVESGVKAFLALEREDLGVDVPWERFESELCQWLEAYLAVENTISRAINEAITIIKKEKIARRRKIAEGVAATSGRDGRLVLLVKPNTGFFDGEYNPREKLHKLFDNIEPETVVARIYPPVTGTPGKTVANKEIAAVSGREAGVLLGPALKLRASEKSYQEVVADASGYLLSKDAKLSIEEELVIARDVDHVSGSIDFVGSVQVKGGVCDGFLVNGCKGVLIKGDVENAIIKSDNGPVVIKGKVIGRESIEHFNAMTLGADDLRPIESGDEIELDSLTSQSVYAAKNIVISRFANRALLSAAGFIKLGGSLAASRARTVCGLEASIIGNDSEVSTLIELLSIKEASHAYLSLKQTLEELLQEEESISLFLGPFMNADRTKVKISESHRKKLIAVIERLKDVKRRIEIVKSSIADLLSEPVTSCFSQVAILKECHPGVLIRAGQKEFVVTERLQGPCSIVYNWKTGKFSKEKAIPLNCEFKCEN